MKSIEKEILYLKKKLLYWEKSYYINNRNIVSDVKYDITLRKLHYLEKKKKNLICTDSPTQKVGGYAQNIFNTVQYTVPMLSIKNIFKESEFIDFNNHIKRKTNYDYIHYCCELKIDGIAISLIYKYGKLIRASTRGNGIIGEDVTSSVKFVQSIPKKLKNSKYLPDLLEIRGEIFITNSNFHAINDTIKHTSKETFSNPRNATSGLIRQKHPNANFVEKLDFFCYGDGMLKEERLSSSHFIRLKQYESLGIPIEKHTKICSSNEEVINFYKKIYEIRKELAFNIDGIVIKVDSIELRKKIGTTSKFPLWEIAYKFPTQGKFTKIYDIEFQVGKTGIIIPIVKFHTISIFGMNIRKASLYNCKEIKKMKLMIGDEVLVGLSGDIVPKILKIRKNRKQIKYSNRICIPKFCPSCQSELIEKNSLLHCKNNTSCISQKKELLKHFVSKPALNIIGIGKSIINQLVDLKLIKNSSDLFLLKKVDLMKLNGVGSKLAENLLYNLETAKKTTFSRFIYSLGIQDVGKVSAENLSKFCKTIDNLITIDMKNLMKIKNVGEQTALNIKIFFSEKENVLLVKRLTGKEIGIHWNN